MWPFKKKPAPRKRASRAYQAAMLNRLTNDWITQPASADKDIIVNLKTLRARSRDLAQNNDYAKRFLSMLKSNVIGHAGIKLQNKAKDSTSKYDTVANDMIESTWQRWGKLGTCTMCGQYSWIGLQHAVIEAVARDGEALIMLTKGGPFGFALHLIEADFLDEDFNDEKRNIRGGVQRDKWGRPVAYYLLDAHPGDNYGSISRRHYTRVAAANMIHLYVKERANQTRGVPWLVTPSYRLKQLGGIEEAELVASRVAASKMGFFTSEDGDGYSGDDTEDDYTPISEASPGTFEQLPANMDFKPWDPTHPNTAFEPFSKSILRGVASGLNVSYVALANDLEGVSYSSIRSGELTDRDNWRLLQGWTVENFIARVYEPWLKYALLSDQLKLPERKFDKFNQPKWRPRGWPWVDPQKEIKSNIDAIKGGMKTLSDVIGETGGDIEDVFKTLKHERELAEQYGLKPATLFPEVENEKQDDEIGPAEEDVSGTE